MSRLLLARLTVPALAALFAVWSPPVAPAGAATGAETFGSVCAACHTIGGGKRVGPDLAGVNDRRPAEWLLKFIRSSQALVESGDPVAVALFAEHKVAMPDFPYSDSEIREILEFVKRGGAGGAAQPPAAAALRTTTPEDVRKGLELFQGTLRFANRGPACNSCHHVNNDAVIGGGILAKELTTVFGQMGGPGVQAILGKPPFPVMDQAFASRPLTEDEIFALVAFLQDADQHQQFQKPRDYGFKLFTSGLAGLVFLLALYGLFWRRRKVHPVNHAIFARQVRTQ
ncbi:MAG: cytochrome c [Candidatus Schekmanbacteria bacterium]|nr:cytochrome c [Candidatus Schekmanbacteria bacterium]